MMSYNFLDHTADIAVEVFGKTREELFSSAAEAWRGVVTETFTQTLNEKKEINLSAESLELLLVDFLSELNYLLFARKWFAASLINLMIVFSEGKWKLKGNLSGCFISSQNFIFKTEIKAVTFHQMKIERRGEELITRIIFDI